METCFGVVIVCLCWTVLLAAPPVRRTSREVSYSPYLRYEAPVARGCLYQNHRYEHGEDVRTEQPCLNCTCSRGVLLCFLRVCPLLAVPGPGCFTARKEGDCCPSMICSSDKPPGEHPSPTTISEEVEEATTVSYYEDDTFNDNLFPDEDENGRVPDTGSSEEDEHGNRTLMVVTSTTPKPWLLDDLDADDFAYINSIQGGCFLNGSLYAEGSAVLPRSFCEYCYCIRGKEMCIQPKCHLAIDGCKPNYSSEYSCCPTSYDCASNNYTSESTSAPTTTTTTTTTYKPPELRTNKYSVCEAGGHLYKEGDAVPGGGHCQNCFCSRDGVRCQDIECSPVMDGCLPITPEGHCCPVEYQCNHTTSESDSDSSEASTNITDTTETSEYSQAVEQTTIAAETATSENEPSEHSTISEISTSANETSEHTTISDMSTSAANESSEHTTISSKFSTSENEPPEYTTISSEISTSEHEHSGDVVQSHFVDLDNKTYSGQGTPDGHYHVEESSHVETETNMSKEDTSSDESPTTEVPASTEQSDVTADDQKAEFRGDYAGIDETEEVKHKQETTSSIHDVTTDGVHLQDIFHTLVTTDNAKMGQETTSEEATSDHVTSESYETTSATASPNPQSREPVSLVIFSGKTNHSYVISVAAPNTVTHNANGTFTYNDVHHENLHYRVGNTEDDIQTTSDGHATTETEFYTERHGAETWDENVTPSSTTLADVHTTESSSRVASSTSETTTFKPEASTETINLDSGSIDTDGIAAVRENDRIIYFSDPDANENFKKIFELGPEDQHHDEASSTTYKPLTTASRSEAPEFNTSEALKTTDHSTTTESTVLDPVISKTIKPHISLSSDGAVMNVHYFDNQEGASHRPDVSKVNLNYDPILPQPDKPMTVIKEPSSSVASTFPSKENETTTEAPVTQDPWALYYRGPTTSVNWYSVPGESDSSPYLYIPGEGTYYRPELRVPSPGKPQVRSPVFYNPETSSLPKVSGPRNISDKDRTFVEIITAPTPAEDSVNVDFGRHHLYKQDPKQSRADSDMKIVSLKQMFQVSTSNSGKTGPKASVINVNFAPSPSQPEDRSTFSEPKPERFIPLLQHPTVKIERRQDTAPIQDEPQDPKPFRVIPFLAEDAVRNSGQDHSIFVGPFRFQAKSTTPKPEEIHSGSCLSGGRIYVNGEMIYKTDPCQLCRCFYGRELCQEQKCPEVPNRNCIAENLPGYCCPRITCGTTEPDSDNQPSNKSQFLDPKDVQNGTSGGWKVTNVVTEISKTAVHNPASSTSPDEDEEEEELEEEVKESPKNVTSLEDSLLASASTEGYDVVPVDVSTKNTTPVDASSSTATTEKKDNLGVTNPPLKEADNSLWGLLKVSGCNIYGKFYKLEEVIKELSGPCNSCVCSIKGVDCRSLC